MSAILAAQNVRVGYAADAAPVLHAFSAQLMPSTLVGVVGPNGSGKSTLVRALSRVLRPQDGAVLLNAADLYRQMSARQAARAVGVVPQSANMEMEFSVREIVEMGRAPHVAPRPFASQTVQDQDAVNNAMAAAGVSAFAERTAFELSGGEWQRVLLARALAQDADVLLLDEPTAHLDLHHQADVLAQARALAHEGGKTVLAVLHDLNLAAAYCDRLLLLKDGRVVADGSPAVVLTPANIYDAYGARVAVVAHPATGRPLVLDVPDTHAVPNAARVHVVCGGGTGRELLLSLTQAGLSVTAGALPTGDADADTAAALGIVCTMETPFAPLSPAVQEDTRLLMGQADAVIVAAVPFGPANIGNLELCADFARQGGRVFLLVSTVQDFTQGQASRFWEQLKQGGAVHVPNPAALLEMLHR